MIVKSSTVFRNIVSYWKTPKKTEQIVVEWNGERRTLNNAGICAYSFEDGKSYLYLGVQWRREHQLCDFGGRADPEDILHPLLTQQEFTAVRECNEETLGCFGTLQDLTDKVLSQKKNGMAYSAFNEEHNYVQFLLHFDPSEICDPVRSFKVEFFSQLSC